MGMEIKMKKLSLMLLGVFCVVALTGCSTVKGLGSDISTVGHWFVKGADKVENAQK